MSDRLFRVTFPGSDELEQAVSYLEVASRATPQLAGAVTVLVDSEPGNGHSLYTTAVGIGVLGGFVSIPAGVPIAAGDLPAHVVRRFGPHLPLREPAAGKGEY